MGDVTLLHASLFAICGASVKQVSHSWHIVLDTCALNTFLIRHLTVFSLLNLHLDSEPVIVNVDNEYLTSVYRSLEIHNSAPAVSRLDLEGSFPAEKATFLKHECS